MSQGEPRLAGHGFRLDASSTQAFKAIGSLHLPNPLKGNVDPTELRAVVIGGGTGAPMSIRTLLALGVNTSAIVAMADDGGSTGILREEAHVTPPGDVRKCLAAFAAIRKILLPRLSSIVLILLETIRLETLCFQLLKMPRDLFLKL